MRTPGTPTATGIGASSPRNHSAPSDAGGRATSPTGSERGDERDDRTLLLDLENLGMARLRNRPFRARVEALLAEARPFHHAVAGYAALERDGDPIASVLAELGVAPLRVTPGVDAAELALLAHARHVHAVGGRVFVVGSADRRFAELTDLGRLELLVWDGQPIATKLEDVANATRRLPRPTGTTTATAGDDLPGGQEGAEPTAGTARGQHRDVPHKVLAGVATGIGIAIGQRITEAVARPSRRR